MTDQELTQALADEQVRLNSYQCRLVAEAIARIVRAEALEQIVKDQREALQLVHDSLERLTYGKPQFDSTAAIVDDALALTDAAGEGGKNG